MFEEKPLYTVKLLKELVKSVPEPNRQTTIKKIYALELLDNLENDDLSVEKITKKLLLNGAEEWQQFSRGGCSLVSNYDIQNRIIPDGDLKKVGLSFSKRQLMMEGIDWIKVQARFLEQGWIMIEHYLKTLLSRMKDIETLAVRLAYKKVIENGGDDFYVRQFKRWRQYKKYTKEELDYMVKVAQATKRNDDNNGRN